MKTRLAAAAFVVVLCAVHAVAAPTFNWTGGGGDGRWSTPANWSPAGPPTDGSNLTFPTSAAGATTNDLPAGRTYPRLEFGCGYSVGGNALVVSSAIDADPCVTLVFTAPVTLLSGVTVGWAQFNGDTTIVGNVTVTGARFGGPVHGSGTIATPDPTWGSISFTGGGDFAGSITAGDVLVDSSVPNVNVTAQRVVGRGTLGRVATEYVQLHDATYNEWSSPIVATLHTGDLRLGRVNYNFTYYDQTPFDITAAGNDKIVVNGSVTIDGVGIALGNVTAPLTVGQTFVVIDNDGSDPVVGTFTGKPEGAQMSSGSAVFHISYHGGDGNDVTLTVDRLAKTWTGAGGTNLWSTPANWLPAGAPASGDALIFPAGATATDDLAPSSYSTITFTGAAHISGSKLTVAQAIVGPNNGVQATIDNDVDLVTPGDLVSMRFTGAVSFSGNTRYTVLSCRFEGPISGTASIYNYYSAFTGGGDYSGYLYGESSLELRGAFPYATVSMDDTVSGGAKVNKFFAFTIDPAAVGTGGPATFECSMLDTLWGLIVDVTPSASDRLIVHGPLTISPYGKLTIRVPGAAPTVGTTFTIVDKDGTDAISGTFPGLPEGSTVDAGGGFPMRISYRGGDGNDVTLTVLAAAKVWTGAGGDDRMANPANWSPAGAPVSGDSLSFGSALDVNNDLPAGTALKSLVFSSRASIRGNRLTVTGALTATSFLYVGTELALDGATVSGNVYMYQPVTISGTVTFAWGGQQILYGAIGGAGTIVGNPMFRGGGAFAGTVEGGYGYFDFQGSMPSTSPHALTIFGSGTLADVVATTFTVGELFAHSIQCSRANVSDFTEAIALTLGNVPRNGILHAQRFTIAGPLRVDAVGPLVPGTVVTFLDNQGSEPIHGTFTEKPEGATFLVNGQTLRISYTGGDGNDGTLTVLRTPRVALRQSSATSRLGEKFTLTVSVTSDGAPVDGGTVVFYRNNSKFREAPLTAGVAAIDMTEPLGTFDYLATWQGIGTISAGTSEHVSQTVIRAQTNLTFTKYGTMVGVSASRAPGLDERPSGTMAVSGELSLVAPIVVDGIVFQLPVDDLASGTHHYVVSYAGDANYEPATASYDIVIAPPTVAIFGSAVVAGDPASVSFKLSRKSLTPVSLHWTTRDGSAAAGTDYAAANSTITFPAGTTVQAVRIQTFDHTAVQRSFAAFIDHSDVDIKGRETEIRIAPVLNGATHLTVEYVRRPSGPLTLDLYLPQEVDADAPLRPLVVALAAHDWWTAAESKPVGIHEATRGYAVAVVRYRTAAEAAFPAQMDDLKDAVRFLRAHAAQYSLEPSRFAIWGVGAAGHLAALAGTSWTGDDQLQAIVAWQAPTDLSAPAAPCGRLAADAALLLGTTSPALASPATFASSDDPPFLIMHGAADCNVPVMHATSFAAALTAAGLVPTLAVDPERAGIDDPSWNDPAVLAVVDTFLDGTLRSPTKRRATR